MYLYWKKRSKFCYFFLNIKFFLQCIPYMYSEKNMLIKECIINFIFLKKYILRLINKKFRNVKYLFDSLNQELLLF